jgi:hypothetical protein
LRMLALVSALDRFQTFPRLSCNATVWTDCRWQGGRILEVRDEIPLETTRGVDVANTAMMVADVYGRGEEVEPPGGRP